MSAVNVFACTGLDRPLSHTHIFQQPWASHCVITSFHSQTSLLCSSPAASSVPAAVLTSTHFVFLKTEIKISGKWLKSLHWLQSTPRCKSCFAGENWTLISCTIRSSGKPLRQRQQGGVTSNSPEPVWSLISTKNHALLLLCEQCLHTLHMSHNIWLNSYKRTTSQQAKKESKGNRHGQSGHKNEDS